MGKRRTDADGRRFFDEFPFVRVSRWRALGVIDPAKNYAKIKFPNGKEKLIYTQHIRFPNGGGWSLFLCPRCSRRAANLWLIDDAPRCVKCCNAMNIHHRAQYGFGREQRLEARSVALDRLIAKLESGECQRIRTPASWCGKAKLVSRSRNLTMRMRRNMIALRLNKLATQQARNQREGGNRLTQAREPNAKLAEAFDLTAIWRARTTEQLQKALDDAESMMLEALQGDDKAKQLAAARVFLRSQQGRALLQL